MGIVYADKLLKSNAIYTGKGVISGSIAIKDNKILNVAKRDKNDSFVGKNTEILDFKEHLILPGFHDSHVHVLIGSLFHNSVNLGHTKSEEEAVKAVKEFADSRPDDPWILGFNWYHIHWHNKKMPTKKSLDVLLPDRPVFLLNSEAHGAWVNSKALKISKVNDQTQSPEYGEIERDEHGEATGILYENALGLIAKYAYDLPDKRQEYLLKDFTDKAVRYGITSVNDMLPYFGFDMGNLDVYQKYVDTHENSVRFHLAPGLDQDMAYLKGIKNKYSSEKLRTISLKEFVDGVPTTYTALLLEPYSDNPSSKGNPLKNPERLKELVLNGHKNEFSIRLHACGDGAVHMALDFFEEAITKYGRNCNRHSIEHVEAIHPDDILRFKTLGITASMQPEHMAITNDFKDNPYPLRYGKKREKYLWALKSILKQDVKICFGSDYPVVDINPFDEIYRAYTRLHNDGKPEGGWNPEQKLTMNQILYNYTYGSAYISHMEDKIGTIENGKLADITVLKDNLLNCKSSDIRENEVLYTMIDGKEAYKK